MKTNVLTPSCDYIEEYGYKGIPNDWLYSCKNLMIGSAIAVSVFLNDVNWDGHDMLRDRIGMYINVDQQHEENLLTYEAIAKEFNKQVIDNQYEKAMDEIREMILSSNALSNNWDGFGAVPVGVHSANKAIALLDFLSPAAIKQIDDCFPESNGTISLKWKNQYSERVSVNIGSTHMSYYVKLNGEEIEYFSSVEINKQSGQELSRKIESVFRA